MLRYLFEVSLILFVLTAATHLRTNHLQGSDSPNAQLTSSHITCTDEFSSPLPIVRIYTYEPIIADWRVPGRMEIVNNLDGELNRSAGEATDYNGFIRIKKRGQSSLDLFPKVGYGFETVDQDGNDIDASIAGLPAEEDWILSGPYSDKTLIRNRLAFHLASSTGAYASRTKYIELLINDSYQGIYLIVEKIKRDENRLDIANLKKDDLTGDELTGGYVFKIDKGEEDWYSQYFFWENSKKVGFQYVSPNSTNIREEQKEYIKSYVDSFELALNSPTFHYAGKRYDEFIDLTSFAEHFIIMELAKNIDAYWASSYYHKKKDSNGGKIFAGPVWDFNIAFGNVNYCEAELICGWMYNYDPCASIPFWWFRMMEDQQFRDVLQSRWNELKQSSLSMENINNFIDEQAEILKPALDRNFNKWPVFNQYTWPNALVTNTYQGELNYLKLWISNRHAWMDDNMPLLTSEQSKACTSLPAPSPIKIYPNPFQNEIRIEIENPEDEQQFQIYDALGKLVFEQILRWPSYSLTLDELNSGIYFARFETEAGTVRIEKIIKIE